MTRKEFIQTTALAAAGSVLLPNTLLAQPLEISPIEAIGALRAPFALAPLSYAYGALEAIIDAKTMEIHHGKHHAAYISNLNTALQSSPLREKSLIAILAALTPSDAPALRNNAGGHWNHSLFWATMQPNTPNNKPTDDLAAAIERDLGGFDAFKKQFTEAAKTQFGSGWAWLSVNAEKKLIVSSTPNQDNPLMAKLADTHGTPILGLDVWEHAYYLKYQNRRPEYVEGFFSLINWAAVAQNYAYARR